MPRRRYSRRVSVPRMAGVAVFLALSWNGFSQIPDERTFVVAVRSDSVLPLNQIAAELQDQNHRRVAEAPLSSDDEFTFRGVAYGEYWLVVTDGRGNTLSQTSVSVTASATTTEIELDLPKDEGPPSGGVSVSELQKPPAREAVRAAEAARKRLARKAAAPKIMQAARPSATPAPARASVPASPARPSAAPPKGGNSK